MIVEREVIITIIGVIASGFIAWLTSRLTSKATLNSAIKKTVYEKRENAYIALFDLMQVITDHPYYIFNYDKVILPFNNLRTQLNLYASQDLLDIMEPFYTKLKRVYEGYSEDWLSEDSYMRNSARPDHGDVSELDLLEEKEQDQYMEKNMIPPDETLNIIDKLVKQMRQELKTDKLR